MNLRLKKDNNVIERDENVICFTPEPIGMHAMAPLPIMIWGVVLVVVSLVLGKWVF